MNALFDTNIVIDALNGLPEADAEYRRYDRVLISLVTWIETLVGAGENEEEVRDFLQTYFEIVPVDFAVAEKAVDIRRQYRRLRLPDAIIWATAQLYSAVLVTRNTKDFAPDWEGIRVPYRV
ncbi:MAG: type II toxin-antitoxin system VapC family toxin [Thermoflexales bacterium]|nr:type II toxin-antitoxin system VapC family toxin [Thermoflexales bacterium]